MGFEKHELIGHDYFSLIPQEEQVRLLNEVFPYMLRNVAFENDISVELNISHREGHAVCLKGTVNIANDIPEPSFLVDIIDYESKESLNSQITDDSLN